MFVFQGYLLGSLGLKVLGGWYYIYFSMKSFFLGAKEEYMVDMDCMCFSWLFFFYVGSFMLSLSICFVDIYGLVLLCRGLGRYPWEDDTYIYCFLL